MQQKKIYTGVIILFCTIKCQLFVFGQADTKCIDMIRGYVREMNNLTPPDEGKVYHFTTQTITEYRQQGNMANTNITEDVYMSGTNLWMITDEAEMYRDENHTFTILHINKTIVWSTSIKLNTDERILTGLGKLKDTLFDVCEVVRCEKVSQHGKRAKFFMELEPEGQMKQALGIDNLQFWYDPVLERLVKTTVMFNGEHEIKKLIVNHKKIDLDSKKRIDRDVKSMVFNKQNKLLPKYHGYNLIDNR